MVLLVLVVVLLQLLMLLLLTSTSRMSPVARSLALGLKYSGRLLGCVLQGKAAAEQPKPKVVAEPAERQAEQGEQVGQGEAPEPARYETPWLGEETLRLLSSSWALLHSEGEEGFGGQQLVAALEQQSPGLPEHWAAGAAAAGCDAPGLALALLLGRCLELLLAGAPAEGGRDDLHELLRAVASLGGLRLAQLQPLKQVLT